MRIPKLLLGVLVLLPASGAALAGDARPDASRPVGDHERDEAIQGGLRYLDGHVFRLPDAAGTPRKPFTVAVHGLVHLLADGGGVRTDGRGRQVRKARAFLAAWVADVQKRAADPAQLPEGPGQFRSDLLIQYTWPLAMARVFFGELRARKRAAAQADRVLERIAPLLLEAQAAGGGWGHHRLRPGAARTHVPGGYPDTLLSSSFVVASSLGLVRPREGSLGEEALARAATYFRRAQLPNGNQPYDPSQRAAHTDMTGVARAAGACFALWTLGVPWKDAAMRRSLDFVDDHFAYLSEGHGSSTLDLLYAALLQRARGARAWKRFEATFFRRILDAQDAEGAFACICQGKAFASTNDSHPFGGKGVSKSAGSSSLLKGLLQDGTGAYVTAVHTLILLLDRAPLRLLGGERPRAPAPVTPR